MNDLTGTLAERIQRFEQHTAFLSTLTHQQLDELYHALEQGLTAGTVAMVLFNREDELEQQ